MKTFNFIFALFLLITTQSVLAQKVVVIGKNHVTPDGFTFLVTENIPVSEVIYFTDNEYSDVANAFTFNGQPTGEAVVKFTVTSALSAGDVVFVKEVSSNTFTVTGSGGTGTAVISSEPNQSFNLATNGDGLYAYTDTDEIPTNGITQIYSVLYTGSGEAPVQNGGAIPTDANPVGDFSNAIVVDGFPNDNDDFAGIGRVEYRYDPTSLRDGVSQTALENPNNYLSYAAAQDLSIVPFTNFNLSGSNPVLTVSASPTSVNENSGSSITFTFTLSANATSNITANFSVGGTATLTADYIQAGAATYSVSNGTVNILSGTNSASVTITPVSDTNLEPDETVILTLTSGTGYDAGSPSLATGTILNDDTQNITPLVAVTGTNQNTPEAFSFVALDVISSGTVIYFTENAFDNSSLAFSGNEAVLSWTSPGTDVLRGEVIVVKEDPAGTFTASSQSGNSGSISLISGTMSFASTGEQFFAYTDSDTDPTNGITEVHSVLFTGTTTTSGGSIPSSEDPSTVFIGALVVDGFAASTPDRTEYDPSKRNVTVDNANFQNVSNWLHGQSNQDLSEVPFGNIIIATGSANPIVTIAATPSDVIEDAGDTLFYTFTMSAPASGDITVNFDVAGTADFSTDYTVDGANAFTASSGSIVIADGTSSSVLAVIPVVDSDVETQESVQLTLASGTGYDGGSPNDATGNISNDDTSASDPLVAITALNHESPDGFSFVAAQDIPSSTKIYFTDNSFDSNTLTFSSGEAILYWISPTSIVPAGQVIVVTETSPDVFSVTRSNGSTETGNITLESGNLAMATDGETFYAYEDNDNDPSNGVVDIYSVLFTGVVGTSGGVIPATEDPSGIYTQALVVDGFPAVAPSRTEYDPSKRNVLVDDVDFEDISNWLFAQSNQTLSTVPFDSLDIVVDYNSDPSITGLPTDITVIEDIASNVDLSAGTFTDDAGDSTVVMILTVGKGTLFAISGGSVTVNGSGTSVLELSGASINIDTYLNTSSNIQYTGELNNFGDNTTTLSLVANDGGNTGLGGGTDVSLGTVNIDITAVNDAPVVENVFGDNSSEIAASGVAQAITDLADATVSDVDSPDMNGGFLNLSQTSGTMNGSFGVDGTNVTSGGDGTIAAGETITVGGISIGSVHAINDGQGGNSLQINFNVNATPANIQIIIRNLMYSATSGIDTRLFTLTLNDSDGTANGGDDETSGNFTISVIPFVPDIALKTGGNYVNIGDTIFFGDVEIGTQSDTTIYILNEGNANLILSAIGQSGDLSHFLLNISGLNPTIVPLDSTSIKYSFTPTALGVSVVEVSLYTNDPDESNYSFVFKGNGIDNAPPVAVCQDIIVSLDQNGNANITVSDIDNGSYDNSGIDTMWLDRYDFSVADLNKSILIELTVVDKVGLTSTCESEVTIIDNSAPNLLTHEIRVYLNANGEYHLTEDDIQLLTHGTTDNVSLPENIEISMWPTSFNCYDIEEDKLIDVRATDEEGNETRRWAIVNLEDTFNINVLSPIEDLELLLEPGICETSIDYPEIITNSECVELKLLEGLGPDGIFSLGTTNEKWLLTNPKGDSLNVSFNVTILPGNNLPTIDKISDVILFSDTSMIAIPLTGITNGEICMPQDLSVTANHTNLLLIDSMEVEYNPADSSGLLSLYLAPGMSGTDTITVSVSDSEGASTTESFVVGVDLANDTPTLYSIDDLTVPEDTYEVIVSLDGITDGDEYREQDLTVTALHTNTDLVTGIDVEYTSSEETGNLVLALAPELSGTDTVIVWVTDSESATLTDTFVVTVIPVNDAPYLVNPLPDFNMNVGGQLDVVISSEFGEIFNDIDDTILDLDIWMEDESELPDWIEIDITGTDYILKGTPMLKDTGCVKILVQAFDKEGAMATDTFMLCVEGFPVNINEIVSGKFELTMYPNPTKGHVSINMNTNEIFDVNLSVSDIAGKAVLSKHFSTIENLTFDMSNKTPGMYMVHIEFNGNHVYKKLIVDRK